MGSRPASGRKPSLAQESGQTEPAGIGPCFRVQETHRIQAYQHLQCPLQGCHEPRRPRVPGPVLGARDLAPSRAHAQPWLWGLLSRGGSPRIYSTHLTSGRVKPYTVRAAGCQEWDSRVGQTVLPTTPAPLHWTGSGEGSRPQNRSSICPSLWPGVGTGWPRAQGPGLAVQRTCHLGFGPPGGEAIWQMSPGLASLHHLTHSFNKHFLPPPCAGRMLGTPAW